jgi:hypothetical protein
MKMLNIASTVFNVIFLVIFFLFILINVLRGLSKGIVATAVRTVFIFISGLLAIVIAVPIGKVVSKTAVGFFNGLISSGFPEFKELIEISPVIEDLMVGIPAVIISPIIYVVIFLVLLLIMLIPAHFVKKLINATFPKIPKLGWAGALCGVLTGVMAFVFFFAPAVGTVSMVGDIAGVADSLFNDDNGENNESAEIPDENGDIKLLSSDTANAENRKDEENIYDNLIVPITDNFVVKLVSGVGGKAIYNSLTVFEVKGERVSISKEFSVMADVISDLSPLLGGAEPSKWTEKEINGIKNAAKALDDSDIVSEMLADILSAASKKWVNNEKFLGISMISTGKDSVDTFLRELFLSFSDSTSETISKDFTTLADVLGVMLRYDMLSALTSEDSNITDSLAKDGFISGLLGVITKNDRFKGVTASVINLGVQETVGILDVPETDSEVYDRFVTDVAESLNDANANSIPLDTLKNTVYKEFTDNGIKVEKEITDYVTEYLMLDFDGRTDITPEEVSEFFSVAFAINEEKNEADGLSSDAGKTQISFIGNITPLENKYSGAQALKELFEDIIERLEENDEDASAFKNVDWDSLSTLQNREIFESDAVTAEKLKVSKEALSSLSNEELLSECEKIEDIIQNIVAFTNSVSDNTSGNVMLGADVESLGNALNSLDNSKILVEVSDSIIESALRSDMVQNNISVSDTAINSMLTSEETDYANILVTIKNTSNIIENIGKTDSPDGTVSEEELDDQLNWVLSDMTENTADVVGEIFDVQTVIKLGIPEEKAQNISDAVNVFFEKMAEAKPNTEDPEDKDVKASKTIFKFIAAVKTTNGNLFEETGLTVTETIHIFMDSEISRETLIAASYVDGRLVTDSFGLAQKITKNDKNEAINVLKAEVKANYASAEDKAEYKKAVCAIGAILDVDVSSSFDSWVK